MDEVYRFQEGGRRFHSREGKVGPDEVWSYDEECMARIDLEDKTFRCQETIMGHGNQHCIQTQEKSYLYWDDNGYWRWITYD